MNMTSRSNQEFASARRKPEDEKIVWLDSGPFWLFHIIPLAAFWTGISSTAIILCVSLFFIRLFFITAGYHRYFSHRTYKTSRIMQFILAFGGGTAVQKGALWWAGTHRMHHAASDQPGDPHSPKKGFWWSHMLWITCAKYNDTRHDLLKDFAPYPELRFLDKHHYVPPVVLGLFCFAVGGWSGLVIGYCLSTVVTYHATFCVNSMAHVFGRRRYATSDTSRNSLIIALLTLGEGWHNNHHHYQSSVKQGFFWWEIDITYYILRLLAAVGIVWDLKQPSQRALESNRIKDGHADAGLLPAPESSSI